MVYCINKSNERSFFDRIFGISFDRIVGILQDEQAKTPTQVCVLVIDCFLWLPRSYC